MKITFDYKFERVSVLINDYGNLWELLQCIEEQYPRKENYQEMRIEWKPKRYKR